MPAQAKAATIAPSCKVPAGPQASERPAAPSADDLPAWYDPDTALLLSNQLCFPLYATSKELVRRYKPYLDEIGLTYTQYITCMVLWETGQASVKELGERLHLDSGTLTPLLKKLEAAGIVTRERSVADERQLVVRLTPEGQALKRRAALVPLQIGSCVSLSPDEGAELLRLLAKVQAGLAESWRGERA